MSAPRGRRRLGAVLCSLVLLGGGAGAHDGPPYPIVTDRIVGPYRVSVWTDPDATDDGTPGGQFWIIVDAGPDLGAVPTDVRVRVSIRAVRGGPELTGESEAQDGNPGRHFVALPMDHEGRFAVHVGVESAAGAGALDAEVDATYDTRPPPVLLAVYAVPFVLIGFLWAKLLLRRRLARQR